MKKFSYITILFVIPCMAQAATFLLQPHSHTPTIGTEWTVDVIAQSDEPLNAVEGSIAFPPELLMVRSLSSAGSALTAWIDSPYTNSSRVSFSGIAPGGFSGLPRRLFTIRFSAIRAGKGTLSFQNITAFMNDGEGSSAPITAKKLPFSVNAKLLEEVPHVVALDTVPPEHFVPEIGRSEDAAGGAWFAAWFADDKQSGVIRYETCETRYSLCGQGIEWVPAYSPYILHDQTLRSFVFIRAFDAFGNARTERIRPLQPKEWYRNGTLWCILIALAICAHIRFKK